MTNDEIKFDSTVHNNGITYAGSNDRGSDMDGREGKRN